MTVREKQVSVSFEVHRRLKTIAFNKEVYLKDLVDAVLRHALADKDLIEHLISEIRKARH